MLDAPSNVGYDNGAGTTPTYFACAACTEMFVRKRSLTDSSVRMGCALIITAVFFAVADIRPAHASCGDYVTVGGQMHRNSTHDRSGHSMPGVPACHGTHCQRQAPLPTVPSKALLTAPTIDAAYAVAQNADLRPTFSGWLFECRHLLADGHNTPPWRPPCL